MKIRYIWPVVLLALLLLLGQGCGRKAPPRLAEKYAGSGKISVTFKTVRMQVVN